MESRAMGMPLAAVHALLETGGLTGKIVLAIDD